MACRQSNELRPRMSVTYAKALRKMKAREKADRERCEACQHCAPDHKRLGPGWIEQDNNGPIVSCPVCNDDGAYRRRH